VSAVMVRLERVDRGVLVRWVIALGAAAVAFGLVVMTKGSNPIDVYRSMWTTVRSSTSLEGILVKATPLILAALAVAVPARAGLVNVGGEGQLIMGGVFAAGVSLGLDGRLPGGPTLLLM
jgi:simple sugar transport system permease protein